MWIKEIQKVTKLVRDPKISFWLNLDRALLWIQEKRESMELALILDILKHGKRFHATVSFDTDTGLKQGLAAVNDYNPVMKDSPINDLLSCWTGCELLFRVYSTISGRSVTPSTRSRES